MINVLVVEDDQVAAEAHRLYVQRLAGFQVAGVVHSGAEALRFCQREAVDVILLDFYLPDIHGLDVCLRLRAAGNTVLIGVSRVTAGRYLKYLADTGLAQRRPHYGQVGRPEVRFIWHRVQPL